uniref:Uncharacterized protein n=2 Tax=Lygus hesperus TaxID=30085 RepID=A0A0K8S7S0_LYGHE
MARLAILFVCFVSIVFPSVTAGVLRPRIDSPISKEDAIARAEMGAGLGRKMITKSILLYSSALQSDPSLNAATKQCIKTRLELVPAVVDDLIQSQLDIVIQRLSEASDAEVPTVYREILKELFKDSGIIFDIKDNVENTLTDVKEECEEQNDNSP